MKKFVRFLAVLLCFSVMGIQAVALYMYSVLPDSFYVARGESLQFDLAVEVTASDSVFDLNSTEPRQVYSSDDNSFKTMLKLFNLINIKEVNVQMVDREMVIPSGAPFGIKMFTEGVVVVGMSDLDIDGKLVNPAKLAGLKVGDIVLEIDGEKMELNEDVAEIVSTSSGEALLFKVKRGDDIFYTNLTPVKSSVDSSYKAGIWVRDSSAGIGTMTYYNPSTMVFAGLGHAITDVDTGDIMPLSRGEIVDVTITGVNRGNTGAPGELKGTFSNDVAKGYLMVNGETGVYGRLRMPVSDGFPIPLALRQEVKTGPAQILTTISGKEPQKYDIIIEKVNIADQSQTKNMVIRITDPELLEATGGIVQGMSGSPIIQDDKLVGAVTHVFVNDLCRGYGIFAENMEVTAQNVAVTYSN